MRVGIPRALFYYYCFPQWKRFFGYLGWEVVLSGITDQEKLNQGILMAVNETCIPVKVFYGHVAELNKQGLDYIFVPRLVSIESRSYICPKLMGLPDMVRAGIPDLCPVLELVVDFSKDGRPFFDSLRRCEKVLGHKAEKLHDLWLKAQEAVHEYLSLCRLGFTPDQALQEWEDIASKGERLAPKGEFKIGVLGHCYSVCDDTVSLGLLRRLRDLGANPVTPEMLDPYLIEKEAQTLPKRVFWTLGRKILGAALAMNRDPGISGIMYLSCFGCGLDSLIAKLVEYRVNQKPFLLLTADEHSGEAGMMTRLEAFLDMVRRRKTVASDVSPYGQYAHSR